MTYDHVVIAAHSDQALSMLADADQRESAILGAIGYSPNAVYLHRDVRLMPKRRSAWASWNFLRWPREGTVEKPSQAPLPRVLDVMNRAENTRDAGTARTGI